jgi:hypothetical protein
MISIILVLFASICNAIMDVLKYRWNKSIFTMWQNQNWVNPSLSWDNKWLPKSKLGDFIMSTILVWVTDFWHFCKFLMLLSIMFAIVFYKPLINWWVDILILYCAFTITFEIFYSKILIKNKST